MDDTQCNRTLDAAATRKRRSSILKSQRPPRTPFSELEFNVATPTDTSKSRRVSFSKRTGVAEFVTNEGTTTWKNFYEEHNKSLETSGNEAAPNDQRPLTIGQLGRRLFDQQFEEIEAVDLGGTIQPIQSLVQDFQNSLNNVNFTQQLAALECTGEKLVLPQQHYELSELTDHQSKLFSDDLTIPTMGQMSNQMNVDFSVMQNECDDLDEIQKDLNSSHQNVVGPTTFGGNMSEYIEVDLNMTHVGPSKGDDMSITDTVQSPKVQKVSKSVPKKSISDLVDKENIAVVNPYAPICESEKFVINEDENEVLVFDGKKLTLQTEKKITEPTNLPTTEICQRKTIMLNTDDDLPNFISYPKPVCNKENLPMEQSEDVMFNISMTQTVPTKIIEERKNTIHYEHDVDISTTQAVPSNIIYINTVDIQKPAKVNEFRRTTIVYDSDGDISMTQAVPTNIINVINNDGQNTVKNNEQRRRTIVYDNDCDISMTQAVPTNIINAINDDKQNSNTLKVNEERRRTIVYDSGGDISMTQAVPTNIIYKENDRQKTIVYEDDNISFTQAIPANLIGYQNETQHFQNMDDISFTQALPQNILQTQRTICNEVDISITQAIPLNILPKDTTKTILNDNNMDVSITQTVPQNILISQLEKQKSVENRESSSNKTVPKEILPIMENALIQECQADIENINPIIEPTTPNELCLMNEDVSLKMSQENKEKTDDVDMSTIMLPDIDLIEKMHTPTDDTPLESAGVCMPEVSDKIIVEKSLYSQEFKDGFNGSSVIENDIRTKFGNLPLKNPIPNNILNLQNNVDKNPSENKSFITETLCHESICENQQLVYQSTELNVTKVNGSDQGDSERSLVEDEPSKASINKEKEVIDLDISTIQSKLNKSIELNKDNLNNQEQKENLVEVPKGINVSKSSSSQISSKTKKSILNELLDMSTTSEEFFDDKNEMAVIETPNVEENIQSDLENIQSVTENKSSDVFIIRRDSFEDPVVKEMDYKADIPQIEVTIPALEYKEEEKLVDDLHNKLHSLTVVTKNRHYENVVSSDDKEPELDKLYLKDMNASRGTKSFRNADDTRELLQMLSEFTDRPSLPPTIDEENDIVLTEDKLKETQTEPRRISFATDRRSVLSKEDLNNISMPQAALQQSRFLDETDDDVATEISNEIIELGRTTRKSLRISSDVVKALQFDDSNDNVDIELSPLKKTAFGETTYMKETKEKSKVIPTYDVSDGIKELMSDLVKPMADVLPFEAGHLDKTTKKTPSTISTQIQANLTTSSQIDIDVELHSNPESAFDVMRDKSLINQIGSLGSKALASVLTGSESKPSLGFTTEEIKPTVDRKSPRKRQSVPGQVIVFDQNNPLNNVLLSPRDYENVHPYNPVKSSETLNSERERSIQFSSTSSKENRIEVERVSTQYNVNVQCVASGDAGFKRYDGL